MTVQAVDVGLTKAAPLVEAMTAASKRSASLAGRSAAISLAIGEPDFELPAAVRGALIEALATGHTHYVDFAGDPDLRQAICDHHRFMCGAPLSPDQVVITHGATAGLGATIKAVVAPGDRVVLPDPVYSLYEDQIRLVGGIPVPVRTLADHHLDLEALAQALVGARAFIYCSPSNPTGAVFRAEELQAVARMVEGTDTLIVADEAYAALVFGSLAFPSALGVPGFAERLIYCQTFSKAYAMTGLRIGYVIADHPVIDHIAAVHRTVNGSLNAAVQRAAIVAVQKGAELSGPMSDVYEARRDEALALLRKIPGLRIENPEGGFYFFPKYDLEIPSAELVGHLMSGGVKVRSGIEFGAGGEQHLRISFAATMEDLREGIDRLGRVLNELHQQRITI